MNRLPQRAQRRRGMRTLLAPSDEAHEGVGERRKNRDERGLPRERACDGG
jgi:hypothetical protein